ncbi:MAG: DNA polymerase III subunit alpha, partial [Bdellovibrionota bacterium]
GDVLDEVRWFKGVFGEDFYLELGVLAIPEQDAINERLEALGREQNIKRVAAGNCHYLTPEDATAQEVLQCIVSARNLDFDRPPSLTPADFDLKSPEEMARRMGLYEGALETAGEIAEKCQVDFKFKDAEGKPIYHLPNFRPEGVSKSDPFDLLAYFRESGRKGLQARFLEPQFEELRARSDWDTVSLTYQARLEDELKMIERTGFAGYFLIVADFIIWAKAQGIPVGPGRGSGAGSLVAYSLQITDIDPIQFNLLFERFINPERISMPDFDIDFCQDRRGEVIEYVKRKYGEKNVCQIVTFGQLQARAVVKDVGRVFGLSFADTDQLTKMIPKQLDITVTKAIAAEPRLRDRMEQDPRIAQVIGLAQSIEGLFRGTGVHAAGVIITENPVSDYCPLYVGREPDVVIQLDKDYAEKIGLVKFDFLGLKTLTVIDNAVRLLRKDAPEGSADARFELARINYRDPKVFELLSAGDTAGVFQVEGGGMTDLCARLKPSSLEDLTAIGALYRPGPLGSGMLDDFIERKHGRRAIEYDIPELESILSETYGVILYQEQVMRIARELAGYSLGQ